MTGDVVCVLDGGVFSKQDGKRGTRMAFGHAVERRGFDTKVSGADAIFSHDNTNYSGDDQIKGTKGEVSSFIDGGDGDDVIIGYGGNDLLIGGLGEDDISGGSGDDVSSAVILI